MNVCVFCASSSNIDRAYFDAVADLGREIVARGHSIVHGGGPVGLMGVLGETARRHNGRVIGVIPRFLQDCGFADPDLTELHVTEDMSSRKQLMAEISDAFIAAPGGLGTLEEILELLTLRQLGRHDKPCVLYNIRGYYDPLIQLIKNGQAEGFVPSGRALFYVTDQPEDALDHVETGPNAVDSGSRRF